jgi:hypothetical protein
MDSSREQMESLRLGEAIQKEKIKKRKKYKRLVKEMRTRADSLTDENYHTEAVIITDFADVIEKFTGDDEFDLVKLLSAAKNIQIGW